ncbi:MAG: hypothetical protein ACR2NO_12310 [Chloroflexota bacterium]
MANNLHYRLPTTRGIAWPLAICAGAFAALPFVSGLSLPSLSRAPAAARPSPAVLRFTQEVYVPNVSRGCRWQHSNDPAVQIADCGDDSETVRVVFQNGRATEYRLIARQDPSQPPTSARASASALQSGVAGVVSAQQPSQPGRFVPNNGAPLRVSVGSGG